MIPESLHFQRHRSPQEYSLPIPKEEQPEATLPGTWDVGGLTPFSPLVRHINSLPSLSCIYWGFPTMTFKGPPPLQHPKLYNRKPYMARVWLSSLRRILCWARHRNTYSRTQMTWPSGHQNAGDERTGHGEHHNPTLRLEALDQVLLKNSVRPQQERLALCVLGAEHCTGARVGHCLHVKYCGYCKVSFWELEVIALI